MTFADGFSVCFVRESTENGWRRRWNGEVELNRRFRVYGGGSPGKRTGFPQSIDTESSNEE